MHVTDLAHDDGALDGQLEVHEGESDTGDDTLHAVNLLAQEDVHGGQRAHLLQARLHLQQWHWGVWRVWTPQQDCANPEVVV